MLPAQLSGPTPRPTVGSAPEAGRRGSPFSGARPSELFEQPGQQGVQIRCGVEVVEEPEQCQGPLHMGIFAGADKVQPSGNGAQLQGRTIPPRLVATDADQ